MTLYATDAGVFHLDDRVQLAPAPGAPSFSGIVADRLSPTPGLADSAVGSMLDLGGVDASGIENEHAAILGGADDAVGSESDAVASSPAGDLANAGGVVDYRQSQVSGYLPGPDTGVQMNLVDPPSAPQPGTPGPPGLEVDNTPALQI